MGDDIDRGLLNVTSEIGKLKAVLLHKPGKELERLTPEYLRQLLFDDIPWLKQMRIEHDEFAEVLRKRGAQVLYVEDLLAEIFEDKQVKKNFIHDMLRQCKIDNPELHQIISDNLNDRTPEELVEAVIGGLQKKEIEVSDREYSLTDYVEAQYPLYIDPLPNLYFMRDPAAVMGNGISINSMYTDARRREPMLMRYIYDNHPLFNKAESPLWYDHTIPHSLEGGDMLVLSKEVIAIGCSERTSAQGIEMLTRNLFSGMKELKEVVVVRIPPLRAFMHLDTVFTMVDYDKFTIYPGIQDRVEVYRLVRGKSGRISVIPEADLVDTLKKALGIPSIKLIESGGGDAVTAAREQWNDSTNTLAIAPGVVVTYSRNEASNEVLRKNGIEVVEIDGSELVRGRGGPRCMSMPLAREKI
ncbi:arginine deiminase [Lutispora sp.]|uniref:arginine deiminase n=1 Tax=Lutispora sp. TaxID=2828727 RepID=UPI002B21C3F3|nr:arginine deiminase [Lutispora sp.]MEA4963050.1 arginine deiminase [Lutispora sp.]